MYMEPLGQRVGHTTTSESPGASSPSPRLALSRRITSPHSNVKTELMWEMRLGMVKTMS